MTSNNTDWKPMKLGDFVSVKRGYDLTSKQREKGSIPVYGAAGQNGFHNIARVTAPGIVIGRSGGSFGKVYSVSEDFWPHNTAMYVTDFKGNDPDFTYYLLKLLDFSALNSGSAQPSLNRNYLYPVRIKAPEPVTQKLIGTTLKNLDRSIDVNIKINGKLEAMAKLIYDYWFVQFDFPDSNGMPYKSSGGKMVFNDELKREIPKGWKGSKIGKILHTKLGGTPSTKIKEYWIGDIPWLNSGEVAAFPIVDAKERINEHAIDNSATALMPKGTCTLSITRHLRPSILAVDACANQSVVGVYESEKMKSSYIYPYLVNEIPRLMSLRTGAQQPHINKGIVDASPIVLPPNDLLNAYYEKVDSFYKQINNSAFQNKKLIELRDWLLPMLMNGQVTVKAS